MWSRSELKSRAKEILHVNYWKAVLVSLIYTFVSGGGSGGGSSSSASSLLPVLHREEASSVPLKNGRFLLRQCLPY